MHAKCSAMNESLNILYKLKMVTNFKQKFKNKKDDRLGMQCTLYRPKLKVPKQHPQQMLRCATPFSTYKPQL